MPERTDHDTMKQVLEDAGRVAEFSEGGYRWGNHDVWNADRLPAGTEDLDIAPTVAWSSMVDTREIKRITLRLHRSIYDRIVMAASQADLRIQGWCEEALVAAANRQLGGGSSPEQKGAADERRTRSSTPRRRTTAAGGSRPRRMRRGSDEPE